MLVIETIVWVPLYGVLVCYAAEGVMAIFRLRVAAICDACVLWRKETDLDLYELADLETAVCPYEEIVPAKMFRHQNLVVHPYIL